MQAVPIELDVFCSWLCEHEHDVVGEPGIWFHTPLALWLSEVTGRVYGVENGTYGRPSWELCRWLPLPQWAVLFTNRIEQSISRAVNGAEALEVLAMVERASGLRGRGV